MRTETANLYEMAFENWLREQKIAYESVVQTHRIETPADSVKNFDFLLWPGSPGPVLVEVKGRTFHGRRLTGLKGLDSWVTFEDVEALTCWRDVYVQSMPRAEAVFVFLYQLEQVDVETDGLPVYEFDGRRLIMLYVPLDGYRQCMKQRSPKWRTVMLAAHDFCRLARSVEGLIKQKAINES